MVTLLAADAFLAKLLKNVGLSDAVIGILSSVTTFAFLVQLAAIPLMRRMKNVKRTVILSDTLGLALYGVTYLLPFAGLDHRSRAVLAFLCIAGASFARCLITSIYYRWANSNVDPEKRGSFGAIKEMISLAVGIVMSLIMGVVMDSFEERGALETSFLVCAGLIFLFTAISFCSLLCIRPAEREDTLSQQKSLREVFQMTFRSRPFVRLLILTCLADASAWISVGFLGTYKTGELGFTVAAAQIINIIGQGGRLAASAPLGRFSDKFGFAKGYLLGLLIRVTGFVMLIFTAPGSRWLLIGYVFLYNTALAGMNANSFNMMYAYVPRECFVQAQAIRSSISGLLSFCASLLGSAILSATQRAGNVVFGMEVYGQQILGGISTLLLTAATLFLVFKILPQKAMRQ